MALLLWRELTLYILTANQNNVLILSKAYLSIAKASVASEHRRVDEQITVTTINRLEGVKILFFLLFFRLSFKS